MINLTCSVPGSPLVSPRASPGLSHGICPGISPWASPRGAPRGFLPQSWVKSASILHQFWYTRWNLSLYSDSMLTSSPVELHNVDQQTSDGSCNLITRPKQRVHRFDPMGSPPAR